MGFPSMFLVLGLAWLALAAALLSGFVKGPWTVIQLGDWHFSAGWLALLLALYNLVRWYQRQGLAKARAWERQQNEQRQKDIQRLNREDPPQPPPPLSPL